MSNYLKICEEAALTAGKKLVEMLGHVSVQLKARADLVTEADFAAQQIITETILREFPDHGILGEEKIGDPAERATEPVGYRWIIDPLDGTTNYVHGVPHFSVSIALEKDGELQVATIHNPTSGETFSAERKKGATLNGHPIHTSGIQTLSEALGAIGLPPGVTEKDPDVKAFFNAVPLTQGLRRTGSAALNLAYVAAGRFDAAWSFATYPWDIAAGVLLIREAGGVASSIDGSTLEVNRGRFAVAATPELHAAVITQITTPAM